MARITKIVEPKKNERRELVYKNSDGGIRKVVLKYPVNELSELIEMQAREKGFAAPLFQIVSGYRSIAQQKAIFDKALSKYKQVVIEEFIDKGMTQQEAEAAATDSIVMSRARLAVGLPGKSAHHTGAAIDINLGYPIEYNKRNIKAMEASPQYKYLRDVLAPRHKLAPYEKEPWHWECDDECIQHYLAVNKKEYDAREGSAFEGNQNTSTKIKIGIVFASILAVGTVLYMRRDNQT